MSTISQHPSIGTGSMRGFSALLAVTEFWAMITICVMWLAVLFTAIYGGDIVSNFGQSVVPSAIPVAFFAGLATFPLARYGFGRSRPS